MARGFRRDAEERKRKTEREREGGEDDGGHTEKIMVFSFSIKRSMALDRNGPALCKRCAFIAGRNRRARARAPTKITSLWITEYLKFSTLRASMGSQERGHVPWRFRDVPRLRTKLEGTTESRVKSPSNSISRPKPATYASESEASVDDPGYIQSIPRRRRKHPVIRDTRINNGGRDNQSRRPFGQSINSARFPAFVFNDRPPVTIHKRRRSNGDDDFIDE